MIEPVVLYSWVIIALVTSVIIGFAFKNILNSKISNVTEKNLNLRNIKGNFLFGLNFGGIEKYEVYKIKSKQFLKFSISLLFILVLILIVTTTNLGNNKSTFDLDMKKLDLDEIHEVQLEIKSNLDKSYISEGIGGVFFLVILIFMFYLRNLESKIFGKETLLLYDEFLEVPILLKGGYFLTRISYSSVSSYKILGNKLELNGIFPRFFITRTKYDFPILDNNDSTKIKEILNSKGIPEYSENLNNELHTN